MATVGMSDIKKNVRLVVGEVPYKIVEFQHVKPGKGAAFVRMKMKSYLNGKVVPEKSVNNTSGEIVLNPPSANANLWLTNSPPVNEYRSVSAGKWLSH